MTGYNKYIPLRITIPFILGIVTILSSGVEISAGLTLRMTLICFMCLILAYHLFRTNYSLRWVGGFFSFLALFFIGACLVSTVNQEFKPLLTESQHAALPAAIFMCRMDESPVAKTRSVVGNATIVANLDSLGRWQPVYTKILLYFKDDSLCKSIGYGDLIVISVMPQTIPGPPNPHMFSFRKYLFNRQIYYQAFLEPGQWKHVGRISCNPLRSGAEICRAKFLDVFRKFKVEGQEFALAAALLLGSRDFLDNDIQQEFSHAGAIHVLSVSGLHVGIMYLVADKMLFFLKRGRKSRKLHQILIIACIWAYAFITGLPSSVVRAALMFSLIAAGKMFKRSSESYNILAVAAFFQLWLNPYEITQVGFQLSYLAVLGIFAFYKPVNDLINPFNRVITGIWSILAVSLAAQLATFPLASFYFHMFPVYFLLTNMLVVPLAALITYFAVFLLIAGAAGLTFEWLAWPFIWSLRFMRESVEMIQSWPGAVIEPVILSQGQAILIYVSIIALFAFWVLSNRKWAFILLGSFLFISVISSVNLLKRLKTKEIIVYQVSGHTAIDMVNNRKAYFIADSVLSHDTAKIEFQIKPHRIQSGIKDLQIIAKEAGLSHNYTGVWINPTFIYFMGQRIALIDNTWKPPLTGDKIFCDLAIISGGSGIKPEELIKQVNFKQLVIDSSVPFYRAEKLVQEFEREGIPCHSVRHDGAFVLRWQ